MPKIPKAIRPHWSRNKREASKTEPQSDNRLSIRENSNMKFYNSAAWRKLSKMMKEEQPLCQACKRKKNYVPSNVTDHIIPINEGGAKLDHRNLERLCHKCHNKKSARERYHKVKDYIMNELNEKIPLRLP